MYIKICQSLHVNCSPDERLTVAALLQMYNISNVSSFSSNNDSDSNNNFDQININYQRVFLNDNGISDSGAPSSVAANTDMLLPPPLSIEQQQKQQKPAVVVTKVGALFDSLPPKLTPPPISTVEEKFKMLLQ